MEIKRKDYPNIKKVEIDTSLLDIYSEKLLEEATPYIGEIMENYPVSTFGLITLLRTNYSKSLIHTINLLTINDYNSVKCNCYYLAKILKDRLMELGINTYFMSYKAHFFSTNSGDDKIKEAHISLVYPTIREGRIYYTVFDPGLKIDCPLSFYSNESSKKINKEEATIEIVYDKNLEDYPYYVDMNGINSYSYNQYSHNVRQFFNPKYATINVDELLYPISYSLLTGYKATIFSKDLSKRSYITLSHLKRNLEFCDCEQNIVYSYSYDELNLIGKSKLQKLITPLAYKLKLNSDELVENIYFMIECHNEFIDTIMDSNVKNEYFGIKPKGKVLKP